MNDAESHGTTEPTTDDTMAESGRAADTSAAGENTPEPENVPDAPTAGTSSDRGAASMTAIVQSRYGSADTLSVATIDRPTIESDQVLVRVRAAGVDRGVWHLMTGMPYAVRLAGYGIRRPKQAVPGLDLAGTVVEVGRDVTEFAPGDEVYGVGAGTFAEYAVADAAKLVRRPEGLTPTQAAVLAISGGTASQALFDHGAAAPGQRVLILGASGGVGSYAVQLAHVHGLHVTGVASAAKADRVRALGADVVLDYATDDFSDEPAFDLIVDIGGRNRLSKLRRSLTERGTLVIVGGEGGGPITGGVGRQLRATIVSRFVSQKLTTFIAREQATAWRHLGDLVADGTIIAPIDGTYQLADAASALRDLEAGRVSGKAVITVADVPPPTRA